MRRFFSIAFSLSLLLLLTSCLGGGGSSESSGASTGGPSPGIQGRYMEIACKNPAAYVCTDWRIELNDNQKEAIRNACSQSGQVFLESACDSFNSAGRCTLTAAYGYTASVSYYNNLGLTTEQFQTTCTSAGGTWVANSSNVAIGGDTNEGDNNTNIPAGGGADNDGNGESIDPSIFFLAEKAGFKLVHPSSFKLVKNPGYDYMFTNQDVLSDSVSVADISYVRIRVNKITATSHSDLANKITAAYPANDWVNSTWKDIQTIQYSRSTDSFTLAEYYFLNAVKKVVHIAVFGHTEGNGKSKVAEIFKSLHVFAPPPLIIQESFAFSSSTADAGGPLTARFNVYAEFLRPNRAYVILEGPQGGTFNLSNCSFTAAGDYIYKVACQGTIGQWLPAGSYSVKSIRVDNEGGGHQFVDARDYSNPPTYNISTITATVNVNSPTPDTTVPSLQQGTIGFQASSVSAGEAATAIFYFNEDVSGPRSASVHMRGPNDDDFYLSQCTFTKDATLATLYRASCSGTIRQWISSGTYSISDIRIDDNAGNHIIAQSNGYSSAPTYIPLSTSASLDVSSRSPDNTAPSIQQATFSISPTTVKAGETLTARFRFIEDSSGPRYAAVQLRGPDRSEFWLSACNFASDANNPTLYTATCTGTLSQTTAPGIYSIEQIRVDDNAYNHQMTRSDGYNSPPTYIPSTITQTITVQ